MSNLGEEISTYEGRWVVVQDLMASQLIEYVADIGVTPDQVVAVTEPSPGQFTLVYVGKHEQAVRHVAREAAKVEESARLAEHLRQPRPISRG